MTDQDGIPKRGRGRPRRDGADADIVAAALDLLRERGYRAFTVDAVAKQTGIAKTMIYRRWATKGALAAAAIAPLVALPDEGDVTALLEAMRSRLTGEWGATIAALVVDGFDVLRREAFRRVVADELTIDLLTGALWTRVLVTHEPLEEGLAAEIMDRLR